MGKDKGKPKSSLPISKGIDIKSLDKQKIRFSKLAKKIAATPLHDITTPEDFLTAYTPTQVKELMFGNALLGPIRNVLEPVSADEQCKRALVAFIPATTKCWLCGCIIGVEPKACEHIIPALRAIMFSGMITTKKIQDGIDEAADEAQYLVNSVARENYLWAHDNCNGSGAKGGMVLFRFDESSKKFVVDNGKCGELRAKIGNLGRSDCYKPSSDIYNNLVAVIGERLVPINNEFDEFTNLIPVDKQDAALKYFAEYTMEIIKLYASAEALELLLTDAQIAERDAKTAAEAAAAAAEAAAAKAELEEFQRQTAIKADKEYNGFLKILKTMQATKDASSGSIYSSIEDINIELKTRLICSQYLNQSFRSAVPIKFSLVIVEISNYISMLIREVLQELWPILRGNISVIESLIGLITVTVMFQKSQEIGLEMSETTGRFATIHDIRPIKCTMFADLYINIVQESFQDLRDHLDPLTNVLFRPIVEALAKIGVDYSDCQDVMRERIENRIRDLTAHGPATPDIYSYSQLVGMERNNSQGPSIQGGPDLYNVDDMEESGGGRKTKNVTKKNKNTKNKNIKRSKKNRKVRNTKKNRKVRKVRNSKKL